jgi:hypothetical protein
LGLTEEEAKKTIEVMEYYKPKDHPPASQTPANHECNNEGPKWFNRNEGREKIENFCHENAASSNNWLRQQPVEGFSNAVLNSYDNAGASIRIYLRITDNACCNSQSMPAVKMDETDC